MRRATELYKIVQVWENTVVIDKDGVLKMESIDGANLVTWRDDKTTDKRKDDNPTQQL